MRQISVTQITVVLCILLIVISYLEIESKIIIDYTTLFVSRWNGVAERHWTTRWTRWYFTQFEHFSSLRLINISQRERERTQTLTTITFLLLVCLVLATHKNIKNAPIHDDDDKKCTDGYAVKKRELSNIWTCCRQTMTST